MDPHAGVACCNLSRFYDPTKRAEVSGVKKASYKAEHYVDKAEEAGYSCKF